jgi:hypothetical protein
LRELTRVLDAPESEGGVSDADFPEAVRAQLNVDGVLWYLAGINLFTNYDSYLAGHNFYLYQAEEDGRFHILAWDLNESFGVFPGAGISPDDPMAVAQTDPFLMSSGAQAADRPLLRRLLAVPSFRADYLAHYRTLLATSFEPAGLRASIDQAHDLIRESVSDDPNRLYDFGLFSENVERSVRAGNRSVPGLMEVADARAAFLSARADFAAPFLELESRSQEPEIPLEGDAVNVSLKFSGADAPVGLELVYTIDGAKPVRMAMNEEAGEFVATIPAAGRNDDIRYYARAELADGRAAFFPASNQLSPWAYEVRGRQLPVEPGGDLVLNEVLADNETVLADPAGEFDDWVEIVNRGTEAISLAGYHLSDDPEKPLAYALPDLMLQPGEHYLVWCDNDEDQGPDHAGFRLGKDGETLLLSTEEKTLDLLAYPPQETDKSWARLPDGIGDWRDCDAPSPRGANVCDGSAPSPSATPKPIVDPTDTPTPDGSGEGSRVYLPLLRNA